MVNHKSIPFTQFEYKSLSKKYKHGLLIKQTTNATFDPTCDDKKYICYNLLSLITSFQL